MKTKTTTREYDAQGRMVKETVVEQDVAPERSSSMDSCTCGRSVNVGCRLHGCGGMVWPMQPPYRITCDTVTGAAGKANVIWDVTPQRVSVSN